MENFLFARSGIWDGIELQAARLVRKNEMDEPGKHRARYPETAIGDKRQGADELLASFFVGKNSLHTEAQERKAVGILMLITNDDEACVGETFNQIREESAGCLARGVGVDDIDLCLGWFEVAKVGSER